MGNDLQILRQTMRELGSEHVTSLASKFGNEGATDSIYSYIIGECHGLAVLNGERVTADFLYKLADFYATEGLSAKDYVAIEDQIKIAARRGRNDKA